MDSVKHIAIAPNGRIYIVYDNMISYYQFANERYVFEKAQIAAGPIKLFAVSNSKVLIYVHKRIVNVINADLVSEELLSLEHCEEPLKLYTTDRASLIVSEISYTTVHYAVPLFCNTIKIQNAITNIETFFRVADTASAICLHRPNMEKKFIKILKLFELKMDNIEIPFECSAIAVSAGGTKIAVSSQDGMQIMVQDTLVKNCVHRLHVDRTTSKIYDLTFSGLKDKLVVSSSSGIIRVFDVSYPTTPTVPLGSFTNCVLDDEKTPSKCHLIVGTDNWLQHVVVVTHKAIFVYKYQVGVPLCQKVSAEMLQKPFTRSQGVSQLKESEDKYQISIIECQTEDSGREFSVKGCCILRKL